ncbi:histidine kinase [Haloferax namakaokahaiae]|uniref:Histidine kinase n=1 Tax=Haloferax namakaokahaiae TaxID=1748331 RepID=A0ABD5ZDD2_9EURY
MSLRKFIPAEQTDDYSLVVVNRTSPQPLQNMLEGVFEHQQISVEEDAVPEGDEDVVCLFRETTCIATSPLIDLQNAVLLINSDLFRTGVHGLEGDDIPSVVKNLDDIPFVLRGYPESDKEKLLLIILSRYIERLSLDCDGGKHRASFQRLSRIIDERGTHSVYKRLANSAVDTHVYGIPDWEPSSEIDMTLHGGRSEDFTDSWFVTHLPDDETEPHAALVAIEIRPRVWEGVWTFDPERVREIDRYIEREL